MNDKLYWCIYWSLVATSFVIHFLVCDIKKKKLIRKAKGANYGKRKSERD